MAHLEFPSTSIGILDYSILLELNQQMNQSPYSQIVKVLARSQPQWGGTATLIALGEQGAARDRNAQVLSNFLSSLKGVANTFDLPLSLDPLPESLTIASSRVADGRTIYSFSGSPTVTPGTFGKNGNRTYVVDTENMLIPDTPATGVLSPTTSIRVRLSREPSGLRVGRGAWETKIYQPIVIDWTEAII